MEDSQPQSRGASHERDSLLTTSSQPNQQRSTTSSVSPSSHDGHPSVFSFPTLDLDGSLPDLANISPRYPPTPPAALSSSGAKTNMADQDPTSEASLDSQYDMMDDVSEISTDDHDTASLVSTEHEDGQLTPEESVVDLREGQRVRADVDTTPLESAENDLLDSYMSEELETPRQSTINAPIFHNLANDRPNSASGKRNFDISYYNPLDGLYRDKSKFTWQELALRMLPLIAIILALVIKSSNVLETLDGPPPPTVAGINARRQALATALTKTDSCEDIKKIFNIDHLLPHPPEHSSNTKLPPNEVRFQGIPPNRVLVSLPQQVDGWFWYNHLSVASANAYRSDSYLDFNQTQLIDGVYEFQIPAQDAYGVVTLNITTKAPVVNVIVEHNFGNRILQRKTYEKAGAELSKAINKDVIVARKNVQSLGEKIGLEWTAGAEATKNVTSELAIYIARDLQVLANTALSVFSKAAAAGNETASTVRKELIVLQRELAVVRKDLIQLAKDTQKSMIANAQAAKARLPAIPDAKTLQKPLEVSRERAARFKKVLIGGKKYIRKSKTFAASGESYWPVWYETKWDEKSGSNKTFWNVAMTYWWTHTVSPSSTVRSPKLRAMQATNAVVPPMVQNAESTKKEQREKLKESLKQKEVKTSSKRLKEKSKKQDKSGKAKKGKLGS